jgi:hypothetical protein
MGPVVACPACLPTHPRLPRDGLILVLVALSLVACRKTIRVTRVGVNCPIAGKDGESTFLPFGRWFQAAVPRFGSYSSLTIQDEGRVLGDAPRTCVAEALPKQRVAYAKEESIYVHDNSVDGNWLANQRIVDGGESCQVIGEGEFLVLMDKGMPEGVVPAQKLVAEPVQYFTKFFEERVGTSSSASFGFRAVSKLDPTLQATPALANAMQRLVDARVREGDFGTAWNDIQNMFAARARFPGLEAVWCDVYPRQITRDQAKHCKPSTWALVSATGDSDEELQQHKDEMSGLLTGPLFPLWRAAQYDGPVIRSADDTPGLPAGKFAVVLGACPEIKAKALFELTRPFVKRLSLVKLDLPADKIPCPDGPVDEGGGVQVANHSLAVDAGGQGKPLGQVGFGLSKGRPFGGPSAALGPERIGDGGCAWSDIVHIAHIGGGPGRVALYLRTRKLG